MHDDARRAADPAPGGQRLPPGEGDTVPEPSALEPSDNRGAQPHHAPPDTADDVTSPDGVESSLAGAGAARETGSVAAPSASGTPGASATLEPTGNSDGSATLAPTGNSDESAEAEGPFVRAAGDGRRAVVLRPPSFGAIEARGLVKFYGTTAALRGCDLLVLRGERVALLGANGAGKTTLLKLLATLVRPSAGSLTVLGLDAVREAVSLRRQLGVVAHETYLYRDLTAAENLRFYGRLYAVPNLEVRIAAELARVGLGELGARRVSTLSRGQQQRLALARALLPAPALLLLDEPDAGLDEAGQAVLSAVVADTAPTVVLTTHSLERALALADRVVVLAAGKIAYDAPASYVDLATLREAVGGSA